MEAPNNAQQPPTPEHTATQLMYAQSPHLHGGEHLAMTGGVYEHAEPEQPVFQAPAQGLPQGMFNLYVALFTF